MIESARDIDVVIVEDSPTQVVLLRSILESAGYRVAAAANGHDGLAAVREHKPAIVVSDVNMPGMDGYEMCRRVHEDESLRHIPVIIVTSLSHPEEVVHALACGAAAFITKPYPGSALLSIVASLLQIPPVESGQDRIIIHAVVATKPVELSVEPQQLATLLLSTFESGVNKVKELTQEKEHLEQVNSELSYRVRQLSQQLEKRPAE